MICLFEFQFNLRPLSNFGSYQMDDGGIIIGVKKAEGNGRTPSKPKHMLFVHHKVHMARASCHFIYMLLFDDRVQLNGNISPK